MGAEVELGADVYLFDGDGERETIEGYVWFIGGYKLNLYWVGSLLVGKERSCSIYCHILK